METMERTREHFFDGKELNIDRVVEEIQKDPYQARGIMEFIRDEMYKEEEFKGKLHELEDEYKEKKEQLYKDYGVEHGLYDN